VYERALNDPDPTRVRELFAVCDARLMMLLNRLCGESSSQQAQSDGSVVLIDSVFDSAQAGIQVHSDCEELWERIYRVVELRRRLSDTESRIRERSQHPLTAEQAVAFVEIVANSLKKHVTDPVTLRGVADELRPIVASLRR
jgi:hypothetical protein